MKNRWHKNATTGYPKGQRFPKYQIKETDCGYLVLNRKTGKSFGTYKSYKYATIIKKILPFYENEIDIELIEKVAHKEYFRYITKNKMTGRYHIIYKGFIRSTHRDLKEALYERDLIVKYDGDEELMCEDPTLIYDYGKDEIPSFDHNMDNIRYKDENRNKYQLEKQIRNHKIIIGAYPTYNLACLIKRYLESKKWNKKDIKKIITVTKNIHKRDKYIQKRNGKYYIERTYKEETTTYGVYNNIEQARYVKNKLILANWRKDLVKKFERKYYKEEYKTKYYYDSTDFFKEEHMIL